MFKNGVANNQFEINVDLEKAMVIIINLSLIIFL